MIVSAARLYMSIRKSESGDKKTPDVVSIPKADDQPLPRDVPAELRAVSDAAERVIRHGIRALLYSAR
jgi:hypothetical protein